MLKGLHDLVQGINKRYTVDVSSINYFIIMMISPIYCNRIMFRETYLAHDPYLNQYRVSIKFGDTFF